MRGYHSRCPPLFFGVFRIDLIQVPSSDDSLIELMEFCDNDTEYITELKKSLALGKTMSDADTWWPYAMFRSRFMLQYNFFRVSNSRLPCEKRSESQREWVEF